MEPDELDSYRHEYTTLQYMQFILITVGYDHVTPHGVKTK